jgi:serine/threonine protein kinase
MPQQHIDHTGRRRSSRKLRAESFPSLTWSDVQVHSRVADGSFSTVLKVSCQKVGHRRLALKCVREGDYDSRMLALAKIDLYREANILSRISHPHIVRLRGIGMPEAGEPETKLFLLLELLKDTLYDRLRRWRRPQKRRFLVYKPTHTIHQIPPIYERLLEIAFTVAKAMNYLHKQQIVHCDLKPGNIGFDSHGRLKLFDFGLSQDLTTEDCDTDAVVGSCRYMAPEVFQAQPITPEADVYSFSILLWELITLEIPHRGVQRMTEMYHIVVDREDRPCLKLIKPKRLKDLLEDMWQTSPTWRPNFSRIQKCLMEIINEIDVREDLGLKKQSSIRRLWKIFPKQLSQSSVSLTETSDF